MLRQFAPHCETTQGTPRSLLSPPAMLRQFAPHQRETTQTTLRSPPVSVAAGGVRSKPHGENSNSGRPSPLNEARDMNMLARCLCVALRKNRDLALPRRADSLTLHTQLLQRRHLSCLLKHRATVLARARSEALLAVPAVPRAVPKCPSTLRTRLSPPPSPVPVVHNSAPSCPQATRPTSPSRVKRSRSGGDGESDDEAETTKSTSTAMISVKPKYDDDYNLEQRATRRRRLSISASS